MLHSRAEKRAQSQETLAPSVQLPLPLPPPYVFVFMTIGSFLLRLFSTTSRLGDYHTVTDFTLCVYKPFLSL
jgi:hypothetical protein